MFFACSYETKRAMCRINNHRYCDLGFFIALSGIQPVLSSPVTPTKPEIAGAGPGTIVST